MKRWRPDNWEKIKAERITGPSDGAEFEASANAILEALEEKGIKGEVKAHPIPAMIQDEISFDNFDTIFIGEDEHVEIILNGAEAAVYGEGDSHIITPKKGHLVFIPEE